ncbi:hypothetical protein KW805_01685 [Candidatus Pacearchaeota archaeon]|nr:hypothetical protein [Candidatus Pacearchaeota archaeon]
MRFINFTDRKRGQISMEYMILVGFISFLIIVSLGSALFYSSQIKDKIKFNQLERFSQKVINSAETVFYAGQPSRATITAYLPQGVQGITLSGTDMIFNVSGSGGVSTISYTSSVPLEGSLSPSDGLKKIIVIAQANSVQLVEG